ncbi:ABC transporter permease [Niallia oryzisoli]|uniref:ABC transporter permease n=1 Tax=Niallia oryzisoli TaxID=1737571 RepID=A0ABZ2CJ09_9BACI
MHEINNSSLFIIFILVLIPIIISYKQKLGIGSEIIVSSIRGFIQLLLLGFFVSSLFSLEKWYVVLGCILLMTVIASLNISRRGDEYRSSFWIGLISIFMSVSVCLTSWILFDIIPFEAQYLLPVAGMFIGTAMVSGSVVFETLKKNIKEMEDLTSIRNESIKLAMIPSIDGLKTVGLVQIPGTMTGMILAGGNPFESVKYQIFILFTLLVVTSLTAILTSYFKLRYKTLQGNKIK